MLDSSLQWRLGRKIYMHARGEQSSDSIQKNGESALIECVMKHIPAGESVIAIDVGANKGEYSLAILAAAAAGRHDLCRIELHAFEPVPSTAEMFRQNLSDVPGHDSVSLHSLALSDVTGMAKVGVYGAGAGTNTMHYSYEEPAAGSVIDVEMTTLADFAAAEGIAHIHLAKVDTEGNDSAVLRGAAPLLRAGAIDVVQFEYNHRWIFSRSFLRDVFELITGLPYKLARVDETRLTFFEDWHPEIERFFQSNYALVHERAQAWFPSRRGAFDGANTYRQSYA